MSGIINRVGAKSGTINRIEGGLCRIASFDPTASASFPGIFSSEFTNYKVIMSNIVPSTNNQPLYMRFLNASGTAISTSDYRYSAGGSKRTSSGNSTQEYGGWNSDVAEITPSGAQIGTGTNRGCNFTMDFYNPFSSTFYCYVFGTHGGLMRDEVSVNTSTFSAIYNSNTSVGGFQMYFGSGGIDEGKVIIYGYSE